MSRRHLKILLGCFLAAFCLVTKAELNIEITQGIIGAVPIAVPPFKVESYAPNGLKRTSEDIAEIVAHDLLTSGRFRPLLRSELPRHTSSFQGVDALSWQSLEVENLVLGLVKETSPNQYTVSFKLFDVFGSPSKTAGTPTPDAGGATKSQSGYLLTTKTYNNVRSEDFRALAHHISDVIFEKLTNIRGAFSTRLAYVLVQKGPRGLQYILEISDVDGHNPQELVRSKEPIMSPAWSLDGKRLAFVSFEKKRAEIYAIDVRTGKRALISKFPGINGAPSWSPDGRKLAVVLSKDGSPKIYLYDIQSKVLTQVTRGFSIDTEPVFEPSGRSLLFTSNRGGKPQIYRIYLQSGSTGRVTFVGEYNARPRLTQDGKYLVIIHRGHDGLFCIARQELSTGEVTYLTHSTFDDSPSVSPNGAMVLYGTLFNNRRMLGVVSIDGRAKMRLPAREGSVQEPAWSPYLS
ncbi:MAG TPA: Tol-Pal system beta propeller repeat protein TolB [Gammaproteobacteria bacterium]|nr:Tol-Pal system beta propeller repeat protein TolB [Gammaproteobacteria bacterium]